MKENLKNKTKTSNIAPGRWISLAGEIEERRMKKEKKLMDRTNSGVITVGRGGKER